MADPEWARRNGLGESSDELPGRVDALLAAGPLPPLRPFYSARNASVMLPGLLAGYGVAPDGRPLVAEEVRPGLIRSFVRKSARAAYRHGVDVVAPTLRKLAAR